MGRLLTRESLLSGSIFMFTKTRARGSRGWVTLFNRLSAESSALTCLLEIITSLLVKEHVVVSLGRLNREITIAIITVIRFMSLRGKYEKCK